MYYKGEPGARYKVEKTFVAEGFRCVVIGTRLGHRCGYVGIPMGHSLYGRGYENVDVEVHGGWTFGRESAEYPVETKQTLWWIGFDCAHCWDGKDYGLISELNSVEHAQTLIDIEEDIPMNDEVRTTEYVERQLRKAVNEITEKY